MTPQSGNWVSTSFGNSGLYWTVFARNRDTAVPAEGNGDLQTLICVLVARPRGCLTLSNPVPWQNWMAAYLGYTLRMQTLFRGWPIMGHGVHTRRRSVHETAPLLTYNGVHLIAAHYSFIDSERIKGWVGLVGWSIVDGLPTYHKWSPSNWLNTQLLPFIPDGQPGWAGIMRHLCLPSNVASRRSYLENHSRTFRYKLQVVSKNIILVFKLPT